MEGLDLLETMTQDLVRSGLGTMSAKSAQQIEERAKQLGNMYLPGAQNALRGFTILFQTETGDETDDKRREAIYTEALDQLTRLQLIAKRGREYLTARKSDPEMKPEATSNIAEWLGHAWQLSELKDAGLVQTNASLVQLYFSSREDDARKEVVETGTWMNLATGAIQLTKNFRPYHALKFIKEDDAFFQVLQAPELSIYPGDMNPRIRWSEASHRLVSVLEREAIMAFAKPTLAEALKAAKAQFKDPLAERCPFVLVRFASIVQSGNNYALQDSAGGEYSPVQNLGVTLQSHAIAGKTLRAVIEALSTTGPGRYDVVSHAVKEGFFEDVRLLKAAVDGVADPYIDIAILIAREVLPRYGRNVVPLLQSQFDPKGGGADQRRLTALVNILEPAEVDALLLKVFEEGDKDMRSHVLALMASGTGKARPVEALVREMLKDRSLEVREQAYSLLIREKYPDYEDVIVTNIVKGDSAVICGALRSGVSEALLSRIVAAGKAEFDRIVEKKKVPTVNPLLDIMSFMTHQPSTTAFGLLLHVFNRRGELAGVTTGKKGDPRRRR